MSEPAPLLAPLKPEQIAARYWREGQFGTDPWRSYADDETVSGDGRAIVSLARWRAERAALAAIGPRLGVRLAAADGLDGRVDELLSLGLVVLPFPKFTDGRAYSAARRLRDAGFVGEIRATGDVLLDQMPLMLRSGFDAFEICHAATVRGLEKAPIPAVQRVYQAGSEGAASAWRSRRVVAGAQ